MRRLPQLDPDDAPSLEVHCFGCGRLLGVAAEIKSEVYCDELCRHQHQLISFENAFRNRMVQYLVDMRGLTMTEVARAFGVTRTTIGVIVANGNEGNYLKSGRKEPISDSLRAERARAGRISTSRRWGSD